MADDTGYCPCVCECVCLSLSGRDFRSSPSFPSLSQCSLNKLLNHVYVSRGSCYQICRPAREERAPNRVEQTPSVTGPARLQDLQDLQDPDSLGGGAGESLCSGDRNMFTTCRFSLGLLLVCSCFLLLQVCLFKDLSPFDAESSHFPQDFDKEVGSETPSLQKIFRKKDLQKSKRGLMAGAYGNYTLIYHLGHGNSCKLDFINSKLQIKWGCRRFRVTCDHVRKVH